MVDTDWREILSFSQRELNEGDKDKLCESLSWMEADDIELNFTDLKTLFRLAQDILKYKSEQVNSLLGKVETIQRKQKRRKSKTSTEDSPSRSSDSAFEVIAHQEEIIKANKDILEQLYADIAELEKRKKTSESEKLALDKESDSSRDPLSELNAIEQLENELLIKNRHIRKLLSDMKLLQDENGKVKENAAVLQEKLNEATQLLKNFTKKVEKHNQEHAQLKEALVSANESKVDLLLEMEGLQKALAEKESIINNSCDEIKNKVQHWKNVAKSKKAELEIISKENVKLKSDLLQTQTYTLSTNDNTKADNYTKELKEKLSEAVEEMNESSKLIESLRIDNKILKDKLRCMNTIENSSETKNDSDDSKQRELIRRLKREIVQLRESLRETEVLTETREKELCDVSKELQLLQSGEDGLGELLQSLRTSKRQLKVKDEGIKSLVQDVNTLNNVVDELQMQNEAIRLKFNVPQDEKVAIDGVVKRHQEVQRNAVNLKKSLIKMENKLVSTDLNNREIKKKLFNLVKSLQFMGVPRDKIEHVLKDSDEDMPRDGGGEGTALLITEQVTENYNLVPRADMDAIVEENEGLRKGLTEILEFIKNNSIDSTGILAVQCPSLEAVLNSMEARHSSGWYAPHMASVLELKAALGGRDALLSALHDARKETFNVMAQLKEESKRTQDLEKKLQDVQTNTHGNGITLISGTDIHFDFGNSWMDSKKIVEVDFKKKTELQEMFNDVNKACDSDLKKTLLYFHRKFADLFNKMTTIAINHTDEKNEWVIQEEKYKAEIQKVYSYRSHTDDDKSVDSPGRINPDSFEGIQNKCTYLEESYKYIRTMNENLKQDYLESKKELMILTSDYEIKMQKLMLSLAIMTDKMRNSVTMDLFWKQNETFNDITIKYNTLVNNSLYDQLRQNHISDMLERNKHEMINDIQNHYQAYGESSNQDKNKHLSNVENTILVKQVQSLCTDLEDLNNKLTNLKEENYNLQQMQQKIIVNSLESKSKEELAFVKDELLKTQHDKEILKEQCTHVTNQLDIALMELHNLQRKSLNNDIEVNMLRHQILDLQTAGDNKAIIARLSGEIMVAHLQTAEYHNKIESIQLSLKKEIEKRLELEDMLQSREKIFQIYSQQYESKFRYLFEIMEIFRQQYQGVLPLVSIENYLNQTEEISRKARVVEEKLDTIEDLRSHLMVKHNVYEQIINMSKAKCSDSKQMCPHEIELTAKVKMEQLEKNDSLKRIEYLEQSRAEILRRYTILENTLISINQCFKKQIGFSLKKDNVHIPSLEVQDVQSDDEPSSKSSGTMTLPKPLILKTPNARIDMTKINKQEYNSLPGSPVQILKEEKKVLDLVNVFVQTTTSKSTKHVQTDLDKEKQTYKNNIETLESKYAKKEKDYNSIVAKLESKTDEISKLTKVRSALETKIENLKVSLVEKENVIEDLQNMLADIRNELDSHRRDLQNDKKNQKRAREEEKSLLLETINQLEQDKITLVDQYKAMLNKERDEYLNCAKDLNTKICELKNQLENQIGDTATTFTDKNVTNKDMVKILELQDKCFKLESQLDGNKSELQSYKSEVERWKELAGERLNKMEQLNNQLQERYSQEVDSYKAENQHWLTQLNETQKEHKDLRSNLADQKTQFLKQLAEKDSQIEQLRNVIHNLKSQIVSMHTMMSATDPSFDLSAIVEAADSDAADSDRLEIRYNSTPELREEPGTLPSTSTAIWQEPLVERLRREKQLTCKQNGLLRRQVRALAARERRARLEAQNLRSQAYRLSTSGRGAADAGPLQTQVAALQAQLAARRDTSAGVALWDKWKRAQQSSDRWQLKYEEQSQEMKKLEAALGFARSAVARLEKEKRTLLSRLQDTRLAPYEKQDLERAEKPPPRDVTADALRDVTADALRARVEAQQRKIAALEIAETGNERLVSEYEKALSEVALLKGQVLKLESALLETQLKSSFSSAADLAPELDYWKSYSEMLKEENLQLRLSAAGAAGTAGAAGAAGVGAAGAAGGAGAAQRVTELEKTVLTLRGLVSKLQAEQKSSPKRVGTDSKDEEMNKLSVQLSGCRTEVSNLRRALAEKARLLQRSRDLLRAAADREDQLLAEIDFLRRQTSDVREGNGSYSA